MKKKTKVVDFKIIERSANENSAVLNFKMIRDAMEELRTVDVDRR